MLGIETVLGWADTLEHLTTVELTDHDLSKVPRWREAGLSVLAGDDPIIFRYLTAGVDGAMVIVPMLFPAALPAVLRPRAGGPRAGGLRGVLRRILPLATWLGIGEEIATTKSILAAIGVFDSDEVRPPLVPRRTSDGRCSRWPTRSAMR